MRFRRSLCGIPLLLALASSPLASRAAAAPPEKGFTTVAGPMFSGEELRTQHDLWAVEVALKPMRMVFVPVTNPKTGEKSSELIWYLVYRVTNRPAGKTGEAGDFTPVNSEDAPPPRLFVPRATLTTEDPDIRGAVSDSIVPEALQAINARERMDLKTPVQIAGPIPKDTEYGVLMFRGVDPRTTRFNVYLSGFSNAYKVGRDESGKDLFLRRTLMVPYRRLADQYDQFEQEIQQHGEPKWVYVPDEGPAGGK
jgi:hypothetical protein